MILPEEKADKSSPAYAAAAPAPVYAHTEFAPSPPSSATSGSSSLRPRDRLRVGLEPPRWPASASETALSSTLSSSSGSAFPPLHTTHSHSQQSGYLVLKQPAASLTRVPPPNLPRTPFPPLFLLADGPSLRSGFPAVPPPSTEQPHPFTLHDVNETDWLQFLTDLRNVSNLTEEDRQTAYCVPVLSSVPIINLAIATAITHHIQRKKKWLASLLVDKWNHHFFHPRRIEVILMRGQTKLSGQSDQPVANLYTPRSVNFTAPPPPPSATSSGDRTYRLFVVSMDG
ncbi:hypothetical protein C8R46DRAFT_1056736 [Mycena filopes]|nr:hypothetical protein C8R46DRAFT_1056736 [Mycena filopes]